MYGLYKMGDVTVILSRHPNAETAIQEAHQRVCAAGFFSKLFAWMDQPDHSKKKGIFVRVIGVESIHVGPCGPGRLTCQQMDDNDYIIRPLVEDEDSP